MKIGIDLRPLLTSPRTGVGEYTFGLLDALFHLDKTNEYFLYYNSALPLSPRGDTGGFAVPTDMHWRGENIHFVRTFWPNKLLNTSIALFNYPKLDRLALNTKYSISRRHGRDLRWSPILGLSGVVGPELASGLNTSPDIFYSPNFNFTSVSARTHFVLTVHDLSFELFPEFFTPRQRLWHKLVRPRRQCERADIIITPSENTKRDIVDYYKINPDKIKVIYPGLTPISEATRPPLNLPLAKGETAAPLLYKEGAGGGLTINNIKNKYNLPDNFILFLGSVEPRKNISGLIKAFEILNTNYSLLPTPYSLVIAGPSGWKNKDIYKLAKKSPLRDRIKFIGFIPAEKKPALFSAAALFVYPSFYEGFGFPVLEAIAIGVPVITSNRSSIPEIIGAGAYLVNPNFPAEIAAAMNKLLSDGAYSPSFPANGIPLVAGPEGVGGVADRMVATLRDRQIKNGLTQVGKFSWKKMAKEWLETIQNLT